MMVEGSEEELPLKTYGEVYDCHTEVGAKACTEENESNITPKIIAPIGDYQFNVEHLNGENLSSLDRRLIMNISAEPIIHRN